MPTIESHHLRVDRALVQLLPVVAVPPGLGDNTGDLDRLRKALGRSLDNGPPTVPYSCMAAVAAAFRGAAFQGLAVVNDLPGGLELVDFLAAPPSCLPAVALDLGTTHLEASLIDLADGRVLARANQENSQIDCGADILTRIHFAGRTGDESAASGLETLHCRVLDSINMLLGRLAVDAGVAVEEIRALSLAGNTTMVHFLLKLDPYYLCREPYIPVINAPEPCHAVDLGLSIHPAAPVWILPSKGSYFGGDLVAGILACELDQQTEPCMMIDVGTNAEVVVGNRDWLIACAGAAGPALEGGVARMGMRAGPGAVDHVAIDPDSGVLDYSTIDQAPAAGICGSGLIDLVAGLYLARVIDMRGKFRESGMPVALRQRLKVRSDGTVFVVVAADDQEVFLSQPDLDALMRSKAAMYSILTTITAQVGLAFGDLKRIYVAGTFGQHIDPSRAITIGMLPDLDLAVYHPIGNSSLAGAEKLLLNHRLRQLCQAMVDRITYIELNVNQEFMMRFSGCRFIPHTDHSLFPSVPCFNDT